MTIDRIGPVEPIQPDKKPGRVNQVNGNPRTDSINISSEAQERAALQKVQELAAASPELNAERIAELRERINDPSYINERVLNATADRIIESLFG